MGKVVFTPNLRRHVECPGRGASGRTVRELLDDVFADNPRLRGYVVDERGCLRKHMMVFVDGDQICDRERLSDPVGAESEVYVTQALSGGAVMATLLIATRKGLFLGEGSGRRAQVTRVMFTGDNVTLVSVDRRDGAWYAVLDHGHFGVKMHRSTSRGQDWAEIPAPEYPPKPEGFVDKNIWGLDREWVTKGIWSLEPALDVDGGLWCGTMPGGLFRSRDRGRSWKLVEALWNHPSRVWWNGGGGDDAALHSICVDPRDPRRVVVAVSVGGVWRSRDGGASWLPCTVGMRAGYVPPELADWPEVQDPHHVVQCPGAPHVFWCQGHMGIYRSTDDLASWQMVDVQPSGFGFAAAVHPRDPDTAWFVPAHSDQKRTTINGALSVLRTRDGGGRFEVLRDGLPQRLAYDLVLRHALAVADDGDQLAFGSSTGNLWVTDDQGDHWHCLANHLPPIYAVRYA